MGGPEQWWTMAVWTCPTSSTSPWRRFQMSCHVSAKPWTAASCWTASAACASSPWWSNVQTVYRQVTCMPRPTVDRHCFGSMRVESLVVKCSDGLQASHLASRPTVDRYCFGIMCVKSWVVNCPYGLQASPHCNLAPQLVGHLLAACASSPWW